MEKGLITGTMVPNLEGHFYMTKFMEKVFLIMPGEMYDEERRYEGFMEKDENGTGISVEQFTFDNNNNQNK